LENPIKLFGSVLPIGSETHSHLLNRAKLILEGFFFTHMHNFPYGCSVWALSNRGYVITVIISRTNSSESLSFEIATNSENFSSFANTLKNQLDLVNLDVTNEIAT